MPNRTMRVLLVEDSAIDAELDLREFKRAGMPIEARRVETPEEFVSALRDFCPHVIISDYTLPCFSGQGALQLAREISPDTPFLFVSGTIGEDYAVEALKNGAADYVIKGNLKRLVPAVTRALDDARLRVKTKRAETELRASEARFRLLAEQAPVGIVLTDADGQVTFVNSAWCEITGLSRENSLGAGWAAAVHPDDRDWVSRKWAESWQTGTRFLGELRYRTAGGRIAWVVNNAAPQHDETGKVTGYVATVTDITERKHAEDRIQRLSRTHEILSGINATIVRTHERKALFNEVCRIAVAKGNFHAAAVIFHSDESTGYTIGASHGGNAIFDHLKREHVWNQAFRGPVLDALFTGQIVVCDDLTTDTRYAEAAGVLLTHGVNAIIALPLRLAGKAHGALTLLSAMPHVFDEAETRLLLDLAADLSYALDHIAKSEQLDYIAFYDALTGLPNRALFHDRLCQHLAEAAQQVRPLAVVAIDIERFRHINESFGREIGDAVLKESAERLRRHIDDPGHVAHLGADGFAALIPRIGDASEVRQQIQHRFTKGLGLPMPIGNQVLRLSARAGVAIYPADGEDAETLFNNAEAALREAKKAGEQIMFYAPAINADVARRLKLEIGLRVAIEEEQFVLHYQPKIDLNTGAMTSMEALIRWKHPEQGLIPPGEFIPILESSGMIHEVGRWALLRAMRDSIHLRARFTPSPRIAVNLSAQQLRMQDFLLELSSMVESNSDHELDLELTESLIMSDIDNNIHKLGAARQMGFSVAIDDFGTGYSSLNYIARLPIDLLKIDRSFIAPLAESGEHRAIVSSIISLAHTLNLKVVAEGVETTEQRHLLHELGCDEGQGYLFCRPLPLDKLVERMELRGGLLQLTACL